VGKKGAKGKNKKPVKAKQAPSSEIEKNFRDLERRLEEAFSDGWRFPSR
jgi:hypothetical protein